MSDIELPECRVKDMGREEVIALFKWYDFRDPLGHPLTNCVDFLELLDRCLVTEPTNQTALGTGTK